MNKKLTAIMVAAGLASSFTTLAADVSVFGVARVSLNEFDIGPTDGEADLTTNKSFFGFKGSQELDDGFDLRKHAAPGKVTLGQVLLCL